MKKLNLDPKTFDPRTVMGMISRAKDKLMTPKQFAADAATISAKRSRISTASTKRK